MRTVLIGCAGASCSGKSTLTEWLALILDLPVIHQDKFFKADSQVPVQDGVQHWDCPDALDMAGFCEKLKSLRSSPVAIPSELSENRPIIQDSDLDSTTLDSLQSNFSCFRNKYGYMSASKDTDVRIYLVDGFLMMDSTDILNELDLVLFLSADYDVLKRRRESRFSYVTLEGTWKDPPNYFSKIVYPAYEKYNSKVLKQLTCESEFQMVTIKATTKSIPVYALDSGQLNVSKTVSKACTVISSFTNKN